MTHLIDKSALVTEIEKKLNSCKTYSTEYVNGKKHALKSLLSFLDTLEVKDVDSVWHDASEMPKGAGDKEILVQFTDSHAHVFEIDDWKYLYHQTKWAYLKDLI